jgi:PPOX class probable FMN-dependent enzyme
MRDGGILETLAELDQLYGTPNARSILKETPYLTKAYQALITASPFVTIASSGPGGLDCSPRGDAPGWVHVMDDATLALPDRRGNDRIDTLRNIISDPRVGLLFLIPGLGETLRVNGTASLSVAPDHLARFAVAGHAPRCVILVSITSVYFQCARAIQRSHLWDPARHADRGLLPTAGQMTKEAGGEEAADFDAVAYDTALPARQKASLY